MEGPPYFRLRPLWGPFVLVPGSHGSCPGVETETSNRNDSVRRGREDRTSPGHRTDGDLETAEERRQTHKDPVLVRESSWSR